MAASLQGAELWRPRRLGDRGERAFGSVRELLSRNWEEADGFVLVMAAGIVVRAVSPLLRSKAEDPAVVVLDEEGRHVVSLLSGHLGGANRLAEEVAEATGGEAVITTATDCRNLPGFDSLAREKGLQVEDLTRLREIHTALLEGREVAVLDPEGILEDALSDLYEAGLLVRAPEGAALPEGAPGVFVGRRPPPGPWLVLSPKRPLVCGVGCHKGTRADEILSAVDEALRDVGFSKEDLDALATLDFKAEEPGLLEAASRLEVRLLSVPKSKAEAVSVPTPSERVEAHVGIRSVAEASALLGAGRGAKLVSPKRRFRNVTVAIARRRR